MLPPDAIARAATRWLRLLRTSSLDQASGIIRADANYTDLTQTQYASALDWLKTLTLIESTSKGIALPATLGRLPDEQLNQLVFERALEQAAPAWLLDADVLVPDSTELPQDAASLASSLGLSDPIAYLAVKHLHGRIALVERTRIGMAGERALVELLEHRWPGSTTHVAETNDSFGYDVLFRHQGVQWHLEIKSTTRRGRLVIYLSRHEYEVGLRDKNWRLLVLGLDSQLQIQALATVHYPDLTRRAPCDLCREAEWQSTSYQLSSTELRPGLSFLKHAAKEPDRGNSHILASGTTRQPNAFAWMPLAIAAPH